MTSTPTTTRRSTLLALLMVLAMFASACGGSDSGDQTSDNASSTDVADAPDDSDTTDSDTTDSDTTDSDTTDSDTTDSEPEESEAEAAPEPDPEENLEPLTASARGVTETEMHVGITMLDFDALKEFGLAPEGWGDQVGVYQSYIDDINARGGIHGRTVVPYYEKYSPLGRTEAEAVCASLTKDVETFVIIGGFLGPAEVANDCIVDINDTILIGGRQTLERLESAKAPWADTATLRERRLGAFLNLLDETDRLEGRSIAVIGSIEQEDIYDVAADTMAQYGATPVLEALNDVPQGDTVATDARWQVLAENIRATGADTVLLIGSTQGGLRGIAAAGLDVETWVLESTGLENLGQETTADDAEGAITITSLTDQQQWDSPSMAECRDVYYATAPDVSTKDPDDHADGEERYYKSVHLYCRNMRIFETLALAAGRNPTQETWQSALDNLGKFELPGVPYASGGKPDLSDTFQLAQFDITSGEAGGLVSISEIIDGS